MSIFDKASLIKDVQNVANQPQPTQSKGPSVVGPAIATAGGNLADILTSIAAIKSGRGVEGNPLLPSSPTGIAITKAAATLPEILLEKYLNDHGHSKAAKILGYGLGGLGVGLAIHNSTVGR